MRLLPGILSQSVASGPPLTVDLFSDHPAHYGLDETTGTRYDWLRSNDLTDNNYVGYATGMRGNAASLDPTYDQYLSCTDNAALSITGALSISAWIKPTLVSGARGIVSKYWTSTNQRSYALAISDGLIGMVISDDGTNYRQCWSGSAVIYVDTEYHIVGVFDPGTSIKVYVNNTLVVNETASIPSSIYDGTADFQIGKYSDTIGKFSGLIDHVDVYARAFNAAEVSALNNSGTPLPLEDYGHAVDWTRTDIDWTNTDITWETTYY